MNMLIYLALCVFLFWIHPNRLRGVRGHVQKTRKNTVKSGLNARNRLKIKVKAEILIQENFQKRGNQLKKGTLTPLSKTVFMLHIHAPPF